MRKSAKDKELEDRSTLLRAWRQWHREQLQEALTGLHRDVMARLMEQLKQLRSARELVDFIATQDWAAVDADTRLIALHEINEAIMKLRERLGLPAFDDGLPGERENAFRTIRGIVTG
jgi:hypothetical protein